MSADHETPIAVFLGRLTQEWVAYSSEGVSLRAEVREIARAHGARAEVVVQAGGAVLSVHDGDRVDTIAVVSGQSITRLDRFTDLKSLIERAKHPDADLDALRVEIDGISTSAPLYPLWMKGLGIVLFTVGFSANVQATWSEVGMAALTGLVVALLVVASDRIERISVLTPLVAAVTASAMVLLLLYVGVVFGAVVTGTDRSDLFAEPAPADFPAVVAWLGWVLFAFGFMLAFSVRLHRFGWVLLITMVTFGVQQGGTALFGELVGTFLAAVAMIVTGWVIGDRPARPPLMVLALSGFFVLTVGALGLEGFTALVSGDEVTGFTDLLEMVTIGLTIVVGVLTGAVIVRRATD